VDVLDTPPGEGYIIFVEYAAQHSMLCQRVYDWVRRGHVHGVRYGGRWWVSRVAPRPSCAAAGGTGPSACG
jgi:hypothetical protein